MLFSIAYGISNCELAVRPRDQPLPIELSRCATYSVSRCRCSGSDRLLCCSSGAVICSKAQRREPPVTHYASQLTVRCCLTTVRPAALRQASTRHMRRQLAEAAHPDHVRGCVILPASLVCYCAPHNHTSLPWCRQVHVIITSVIVADSAGMTSSVHAILYSWVPRACIANVVMRRPSAGADAVAAAAAASSNMCSNVPGRTRHYTRGEGRDARNIRAANNRMQNVKTHAGSLRQQAFAM